MISNPRLLCEQAIGCHQKGNLADAERLYLQALGLEPANFTARHLLGVLRSQQGRYGEALDLIGAALTANPRSADALANHGNVLLELARFEEALESYDRALAIQPAHGQALYNRGNTLLALGRFEQARVSYDAALAIAPGSAKTWNNRSIALRNLKNYAEGLESAEKALAIQPDFAQAWNNRGICLRYLERLEDALAHSDQALARWPGDADLLGERGHALCDLLRPLEALAQYDRALAARPDHAETLYNRAVALRDLGRTEEAMESCDRAIAMEPDHAEAHWHKSLCALQLGRFDSGWPLYEWRKRMRAPIAAETFPQPLWTGAQDIAGKTLFIHAEQGLGDTIQFSRYAGLAAARGARVILAVQSPLVRLLQSLNVTVIGAKAADCDYHIPLLSMPLALKSYGGAKADAAPYLRAEPDRVRQWRDKIGTQGFRIGICWQGDKAGKIDVGRSFPLSHFQALADIAGVRLISLQKKDGTEQLSGLPSGMQVETLGDDFDAGPDAFLDTVAVMENLDLIISPDTAVAHVAGALGRPTWLALKRVPDWRWGLSRTDNCWYPNTRLFRQATPGDWHFVFDQLREALLGLDRAGCR